jgi:hypothetical protein
MEGLSVVLSIKLLHVHYNVHHAVKSLCRQEIFIGMYIKADDDRYSDHFGVIGVLPLTAATAASKAGLSATGPKGP